MGSIPVRDEALIRIYRCGTCHKAYSAQVGPIVMCCDVAHPPGTCCHFAERPVSEETLRAVRELLASPVVEPVAIWDNVDDSHSLQTSTVTDGLESREVTSGSP